MNLISLQNISIKFNGKFVIQDFSMDINKGDKAVIKGDSGSGKSTLLNVILGLVIPFSGEAFFKGTKVSYQNIKELRNSVCWLPQNVNIADEDVFEFIMLPFTYKHNKSIKPAKEEIEVLLKKFMLKDDIYNQKMSEASIGEKQRILMIRGLLLKRPILLFDEPTASIDSNVKKVIIDYLFNNTDLTIISASHDNEWINKCNKVFEINK